jgi:hypothetical protein
MERHFRPRLIICRCDWVLGSIFTWPGHVVDAVLVAGAAVMPPAAGMTPTRR